MFCWTFIAIESLTVNTLTSFCAEKLGSYVLNTPLKIVAELLALLQHIVYKL